MAPQGPLDVVQIDHTPVDLIVVDSFTRMPYGKPFITALIDVFSRMVLGFYITFDDPNMLSVGQCIVHAILPKEAWLKERDIDFKWDAWGLFRKIHADNAGEFRGGDIRRACEEYGIDIEWRPVATPHYGGHIESLLDTLSQDIHNIPGTTFSNTVERSEYDSEGKAIVTLEEFERYFTISVIGKYHHRIHSQLRVSPVTRFEQGIFGYEGKPGSGLPEIVLAQEKLWLDFLPSFERTIQDYGVSIDEIRYDDAVLNQFRGARNPKNSRMGQIFIFKRDPRNINKIYFYHPDLKQYFPIPYRNLSNPAMSLWELKAVRRRLNEKNINRIESEEIIFRALEEMRGIIVTSKDLTKKVRKENERNQRLAKCKGAMPGPEPPFVPTKPHKVEKPEAFSKTSGSEKSMPPATDPAKSPTAQDKTVLKVFSVKRARK